MGKGSGAPEPRGSWVISKIGRVSKVQHTRRLAESPSIPSQWTRPRPVLDRCPRLSVTTVPVTFSISSITAPSQNRQNFPMTRGMLSHLYVHLEEVILEKAVAVTRAPRAEPRSLAETRRRGEFESYAGCFMKISLHPIGEGHPF